MKLKLTSVLLLLSVTLGTTIHAQTISTYYKDKYLSKEVPEKRANYVKTIKTNSDGSVTTEIKQIKSGLVIRSETYKDNMAVGTWIYAINKSTTTYDYNFEVVYKNLDTLCIQAMKSVGIEKPGIDNPELEYVAPKLKSGQNLLEYIAHNMSYPTMAKENGIQGVVYINYDISESGELENIVVISGAHPVLDKEACRIVRTLEFSGPATLNGEPVRTCHTVPMRYLLN